MNGSHYRIHHRGPVYGENVNGLLAPLSLLPSGRALIEFGTIYRSRALYQGFDQIRHGGCYSLESVYDGGLLIFRYV